MQPAPTDDGPPALADHSIARLRPDLPRLPDGFVRRSRLDKQLDRLSPLTVVRGLPGTGKTSLVTGWIEQQDARLLAAVVPADPGPARFTRRLSGALERLGLLGGRPDASGAPVGSRGAGGAGDPDRAGGAARAQGPDGDGRATDVLVEAVANLAADHQLVLVVDDAHHLVDEAWWRGVVVALQRSRRLHVIACTYGRHPLDGLAAGRIDRTEIASEELHLATDEIEAMAEALGRPVRARDSRRLREAFGGWAAPTRLALGVPGAHRPAPDGDAPFDVRAGMDFLREHVLPRSAATARFRLLSRLAIARRLDEALAADLAPGPAVVRGLEENGVLSRAVERGMRVFTLPSAVREVVVTTAAEHDPAAVSFTHRELSAWFERLALDTGRSADALLAFAHAVDGADWLAAHRVWSRFESSLSMEHPDEYLRALRAVPADVLADRPAWQVAATAMAVAVARLDAARDRGMSVISAHVDAARDVPLDPDAADLPLHDLLFLGTYQMCARREAGYDVSDELGERLLRAVERRLARGEQPGDRLSFFLLHHGLNKEQLGDQAAAMRLFRQAWRSAPEATAPHHMALAAAVLAERHALRGDRDQALEWLRHHDTWHRDGTWGSEMIAAPARVARAMQALDRLDAGATRAALAELGDGHGPGPSWPLICHLAAHEALHFGDAQAALPALVSARESGDHRFHAAAAADPTLLRTEAELLIGAGRAHQVAELLAGADPGHPAIAAASAFAELACGRHTAARMAVAHAAARAATPREQLDLALADAVAALHLGDTAVAVQRARHVTGLVRATGILCALGKVDRDDLARLGVLAELREEDRRRVCDGRTIFPTGRQQVALTTREQHLLRSLQAGRSRQQIAVDLYVSLNTVKTQLRELYRKLDVRSSAEAVLRTAQLGLLPTSPDAADRIR